MRVPATVAWVAAVLTWLAVGLTHGLIGYPGRAPRLWYGFVIALAGLAAAVIIAVAAWAVVRPFQRERRPFLPLATEVALAQVPLMLEPVAALMLLRSGPIQIPGYFLAIVALIGLFPAGLIVAIRRGLGTPVWLACVLGFAAWYGWIYLFWKPVTTARF